MALIHTASAHTLPAVPAEPVGRAVRATIDKLRVGKLVTLTLVSWNITHRTYQPEVAPGGVTCCHNTSMTLQFGVGGEAVLWKGVGLGAEIGALGTRQYFSDTVMGAFSPNGFYHFRHGEDIKSDPFVTGGYTLLFRSGHANLANFGGGLTYWFHSRIGARVEIRDQFNTTGTVAHFWGARFGLAFR